jgi:tRNA (guanine-N7-)-methyltransferase
MREVYRGVPELPSSGGIPVAELAGGPGSIELEVGFGRARFLLERAAGNPGVRFLGIETRRKWVHRVAERAAARGLTNVVARHGDARTALARMVPDAVLARVVVNFPDPWWKARHEKRLVLGEGLLPQVARLLVDGGELFVQTDVDFRADAYREALVLNPDLEPAAGDGRIDANPFGARSSREAHCEEVGLTVYRLLFRRKKRG